MHTWEKVRVAARTHQCWLCGDDILVGQRYVEQSVVDGHRFSTVKDHVPCRALLDTAPDMYDYDESHAWDGIPEYLYRRMNPRDALDTLAAVPLPEDRAWLEAKYVSGLTEKLHNAQSAYSFRYADMFAGIGGFHVAMSELGGQLVWAAEKDPLARKTYLANFRESTPQLDDDDVYARNVEDVVHVPDHDMLCAGFPCQPFSVAGFRRGLDDVRGTMFWHILRVVAAKKPEMFFLENVLGLINHDNGQTLRRMLELLREQGYDVEWHRVNAEDHGLPQSRRRVYILGRRRRYPPRPAMVTPPRKPLAFTMSDVFGGKVDRDVGYTVRCGGRRSGINSRHNWDAYRVDGVVQYLSVAQAARMMGLPANFVFPVSEAVALRQLGNSVAVPAVIDWGRALLGWK